VFALRIIFGGYESKETLISISEVLGIRGEDGVYCSARLHADVFFTICFMYSRFSQCMLFHYCLITPHLPNAQPASRPILPCLGVYTRVAHLKRITPPASVT
jgi:hypothetical protein